MKLFLDVWTYITGLVRILAIPEVAALATAVIGFTWIKRSARR